MPFEQNSLPRITQSTLPFFTHQCQRKLEINNISTENRLKVWTLVQKQYKGGVALSQAMPITESLEFLPSVADRAYKRWRENGLLLIN